MLYVERLQKAPLLTILEWTSQEKFKMFNKVFSICVICIVLVTMGCAHQPHPYENDHSRALNIARAGDIFDTDLYDSKDGMKSYSTSFLMSALNLANLATSFQGSAIGLGGTANFLVKGVDIMAAPDNPSARPSLVAWLPKSSTEDESKARETLLDKIDEAMKLTAEQMEIKIKRGPIELNDPKIAGLPFIFWEVDGPKYGCTDWNCYFAVYANKPYECLTPEFLKQQKTEESSYVFAANHPKRYSRLILRQKNGRDLPEKDFYETLSKHLPVWVALYFPPGSIYQEGKPITYPVVFEKGEMLLFKSPS